MTGWSRDRVVFNSDRGVCWSLEKLHTFTTVVGRILVVTKNTQTLDNGCLLPK